ncbi:SRPBCC family protein [Chelativorans salis]|uniref:SRPBCC domain-containing protein n=1 Tax=Chelativorans salis TaxID=2978478 RepID=A0ABT2LNM2_9HYPH|nr:SRPBCC domain-containing protein [Chelativorans sp. EGI FJ00035]MCT7376162.1 SRPBCC domain-containing protein [Chelativorans sp. EGI FJ00035]
MSHDTFSLRITRKFDAAPERVFDAWLDPEKVRAWMGMALSDFGLSGDVRRVEIEPRIGGRFTFSDMREEGEAVHWGSYLAIDRPRKLVFTWFTSEEEEKKGISTVTITIEPDGQGALLTLLHEMDSQWAEYEEQITTGWTQMLGMQARLLERQAR